LTSYADSVRFLYSLGNEIRTIKLGLDRIRALLAELGDPHRACRYVHVAGTNGKGSVSAMIEAGLRAGGIRTGLYSSPHLVEPTERIRIAGVPVTRDQFASAFTRVHRAAEEMLRREALDAHPTYFETLTAMAFLLFAELNVELAVLEVGLGGRLDATNTVTPEMCVITRVDYDHEMYLGSSLESIAAEKAGIFKPAVPVIIARQRPEVLRVLRRRADALGAPVWRTDDWRVADLELGQAGSRFRAIGPGEQIPLECPLAGEHQVENTLAAVVALRRLGVGPEAARTGIRTVRWPGRLEKIASRPDVILDGAHNPAGIRALAAYVRRFYAGRHVWLVYGAMRDKSLDEIAGVLSPLADRIILTNSGSDRALRPEVLVTLFDGCPVRIAATVPEALDLLKEAAPEDAIFVTGSLILVGEVRARFLDS